MLQPWQERVVEELKDLNDKLYRLEIFLTAPMFTKLPMDEQIRLRQQSVIMRVYSNILKERIDNFLEEGPSAQAAR